MSHSFHSLRIAEVSRETTDAVSILFHIPEDLEERFTFSPGQHLTLRASIEGEDVRRNYSLCAAPHERVWRVAIKRLPGGLFSGWANEILAEGDTIDVLAPTGSFTWEFNSECRRHYALFASGSGITPILSLLKEGLASERDSHFALFYGNRDSDSILFLEEIAALKDRYLTRVEIHHFLSREEDELDVFNGRIDAEKMALVTEQMLDVPRLEAVFACGPEGMMDAVETALVNAGFSQSKILTERFAASELTVEQRAALAELEVHAAGKPIKVTLDGRSRMIEFDPKNGSILENARASGLRTPFSCKAGVCATCRARVTKGEVKMIRNYGLSQKEVDEGYVLTCQAIPVTDNVAVDFDQ